RETRQVLARAEADPSRVRPRDSDHAGHRRADAGAHRRAVVAPQSVLAERRHLGRRLRSAWARRARADHVGDGARLLRAPAGEAQVHALHGARLDHARGVSSGARSGALAGGRMTEQLEPLAELARRIDVIESGYEFLLAYAAQGRESDRGAGQGRS